MNTPIQLNDIPLTKLHIAEAGAQLAATLLDAGEMTPLSAYIKLRALRDALDEALTAVQPAAFDQAERDPHETLHGVAWQVRNGRTTYDYSHDAAWAELQAGEKAVAERRKAREQFLRSLDREMVDPETGEFVSPAAVKSVGSAVLALTFPKE